MTMNKEHKPPFTPDEFARYVEQVANPNLEKAGLPPLPESKIEALRLMVNGLFEGLAG